MVKNFVFHMREMYGELWEKTLRLIRVHDQSKNIWKDICVVIDAVIIYRSASWW